MEFLYLEQKNSFLTAAYSPNAKAVSKNQESQKSMSMDHSKGLTSYTTGRARPKWNCQLYAGQYTVYNNIHLLLCYLIGSSFSDSWRAYRKTCSFACFDLLEFLVSFARFWRCFTNALSINTIFTIFGKKSFSKLLCCDATVTINVHHFLFCMRND